MKTPWRAASALILLVSASTANGDAASKAKLLDQFMGSAQSEGEHFTQGTANEMIGRDPRIKPADREKFSKSLAQAVNKEELQKRIRDIADKELTEEELKYIVALFASDIFKKMNSLGDKVRSESKKFAKEEAIKSFEKVTQLKYQENFPPPPPPPAPDWLTKTIWQWIPSTAVCQPK